MAAQYTQRTIRDAPELVEICTHCRHADCIGTCREYRAKADELLGITREPRAKPKPPAGGYRCGRRGKQMEAFGEKHNLREWADRYRVSYYALMKRLRNGWTLEEALTAPKGARLYRNRPGPVPMRLNVDGMSLTLDEWAREAGVNRSTIYMRLRMGWTAREAVYGKRMSD